VVSLSLNFATMQMPHTLWLSAALYEKGAEVVESIDIPRNDTTY